MACTGVLHIVLHFLCPTRPSGNLFRPSKVSFSAIFAVLCDLFCKTKIHIFKKGHFPQQIWLKICVWNPKNLLDLNPRAGKWDFFGPKISLKVGVLKKAEITPEAQGCPPQPAPLQKSPLQGIHPCQKVFIGYTSLSRSFYRVSIPVKKFLQNIHPCQAH